MYRVFVFILSLLLDILLWSSDIKPCPINANYTYIKAFLVKVASIWYFWLTSWELGELNRLARDLPELQERNTDLLTKVGRMLEEEERTGPSMEPSGTGRPQPLWPPASRLTWRSTRPSWRMRWPLTAWSEKMMSGGEVSLLSFIHSSGGSREEALKSITSGLDLTYRNFQG